MSDAGGSKNDPKPGKKREQRTPPVSKEFPSLFSLCYLLLEKLSKSLIPLRDCPFVLNRLPVFLGKSPCFRGKNRFVYPRLSGQGRSFLGDKLLRRCYRLPITAYKSNGHPAMPPVSSRETVTASDGGTVAVSAVSIEAPCIDLY